MIPRSNETTPFPRALIWTLTGIGLLSRALPLSDIGGRLLRQFPIDDGYLMLTMARNISLGLGMSVSAGTVPTNGTQPLMTLVYAGLFSLADGARVPGVLLALLLQAILAVLTALCIFRLLRRLLAERPDASNVAAFAAALWFASPMVLMHSMNTLETGGYLLGTMLVASAFARDRSQWQTRQVLGFGALLGLVFLIRNDAVFLIAVVCLLHWVRPSGIHPRPVGVRLAQAMMFGVVSVLVASPWLYYNVSRFGHVVPISGRAEALGSTFGANFGQLLTVLPEYMLVVLPVPGFVQETYAAAIVCGVFVLAMIPLYVRLRRATVGPSRDTFDFAAGLLVLLSIYYGLFFGAQWFVARFLSVTSPFFAMAFAVGFAAWLRRALRLWGPLNDMLTGAAGRVAAFAVLFVLIIGLNARLFVNGADHPQFQMWEWVNQHVDESVWVAAPQSGVLGFFHDRTLNLDGKVSEAALQARMSGRVGDYAIDHGAMFILDWVNIVSWADRPTPAGRLEVIVNDPVRNLAVLRVVPRSAAESKGVDAPVR